MKIVPMKKAQMKKTSVGTKTPVSLVRYFGWRINLYPRKVAVRAITSVPRRVKIPPSPSTTEYAPAFLGWNRVKKEDLAAAQKFSPVRAILM